MHKIMTTHKHHYCHPFSFKLNQSHFHLCSTALPTEPTETYYCFRLTIDFYYIAFGMWVSELIMDSNLSTKANYF
jgi:hypothetical protein